MLEGGCRYLNDIGMTYRIAESNPLDDYNSWQETPKSEDFKDKLDTEVIVVEGNCIARVSTSTKTLISAKAMHNSRHEDAIWPRLATGAMITH